MNCQEALQFIHGYVDGELDLLKSLEIEQHLQDCAACASAYRNLTTLQAALKDSALYYQSPAGLRQRVRAQVQQAVQPAPTPRVLPWRWIGMAAALAAAVLLTFFLTRALFVPSGDDTLTQEVIASHVRAEITDHLADVASSDQHTVKPWFNGKLDFSPQVPDLASQGFPLIGGRLDYLAGRSVAALVYRRQQHIINLFIWPATGSADAGVATETRQGYNVAHWTQAGMTYWAITDLNATEFQQFVQLFITAAHG
jgi:anti-sigma factor RsiW